MFMRDRNECGIGGKCTCVQLTASCFRVNFLLNTFACVIILRFSMSGKWVVLQIPLSFKDFNLFPTFLVSFQDYFLIEIIVRLPKEFSSHREGTFLINRAIPYFFFVMCKVVKYAASICILKSTIYIFCLCFKDLLGY